MFLFYGNQCRNQSEICEPTEWENKISYRLENVSIQTHQSLPVFNRNVSLASLSLKQKAQCNKLSIQTDVSSPLIMMMSRFVSKRLVQHCDSYISPCGASSSKKKLSRSRRKESASHWHISHKQGRELYGLDAIKQISRINNFRPFTIKIW